MRQPLTLSFDAAARRHAKTRTLKCNATGTAPTNAKDGGARKPCRRAAFCTSRRHARTKHTARSLKMYHALRHPRDAQQRVAACAYVTARLPKRTASHDFTDLIARAAEGQSYASFG